ncbi:hypothetical protein [Cereibacter azotoformans]|uniref:Uncharacterized protein n=1 Tax=Cereibacter azotoformans TaxID=43057 RepID=A0A2T5JJJ0_9RHOB|nr:hypothetical protein [Cereibacter azotoformans]PTR06510.1 hypothetical protein C8J28_1495 [Cereibacter azotoformans]
MAHDAYAAQVALLVRLLPFIGAEPVLALKGGSTGDSVSPMRASEAARGLCVAA